MDDERIKAIKDMDFRIGVWASITNALEFRVALARLGVLECQHFGIARRRAYYVGLIRRACRDGDLPAVMGQIERSARGLSKARRKTGQNYWNTARKPVFTQEEEDMFEKAGVPHPAWAHVNHNRIGRY